MSRTKTWTESKDPRLLLFCQKCTFLSKLKTKIKDGRRFTTNETVLLSLSPPQLLVQTQLLCRKSHFHNRAQNTARLECLNALLAETVAFQLCFFLPFTACRRSQQVQTCPLLITELDYCCNRFPASANYNQVPIVHNNHLMAKKT